MQPLTKKQKAILDYITTFINDHGYSPSYREIAEHFGYSSIATVSDHIETLKIKGNLQKNFNTARSLQLTPAFDELSFEIPLVGSIAAGAPIQAIRTHETITIPRDMMGPKVFALKVRGDSMEDEGILDGDYVIIEQLEIPRNGDIVVALLDGENVTLKKYFREKDHVRLQPANGKYKPIKTNKVTIQGKVRGVIRRFAY
jgi:repressor LexA